ncbi:MAG: Bax inhibitor-1/YccA family protein [Spirochaetaceae bacterium]|jgi:FtsH-binding integral membrane protein|nr:Bax inhibitor-1/YccA family protein [Spirochaetaceae bacterium]
MEDYSIQNPDVAALKAGEKQRFIVGVYCWMAAALVVTGGAAFAASANMTFMRLILTNSFLFFGLIITEFALVMWLSAGIRKMSAPLATAVFFLYALVNGLTLSVVFFAFTRTSIALAFFLSAAIFGGMSAYGLITKNDLTRVGSYLMMALVGLILASVINIFINSSAYTWMVSMATVVIFTGLSAWDAQKLKNMAVAEEGTDIHTRQSIYGALQLYLDFINIFLALVRLFGKRN